MQLLYVTTSYTFTSGTYPNYPGIPLSGTNNPFIEGGQSFYINGSPYQPAVEAGPLVDYVEYPEDWAQGQYLENAFGNGYWTYTITAMSFTKPADFDSEPEVSDGHGGTGWKYALAVVGDNFVIPVILPVVNGISRTATTHNQTFQASSLFTVSDPAGRAITEYQFWDTGAGGGHFILNGVARAANTVFAVQASQLSQVQYQSGSGADTLQVEAYDGSQWSAWSNQFTVTGPVDSGPVVTPVNLNVAASHDQIFSVSPLVTYSDPFGSAATKYDVWNAGTGGGHFVLNGVSLGANQDNVITAAQFAQLTYQSGSGADTLWVEAFDGTVWGPWSKSFTVTAPIDHPPVVTASDQTLNNDQSLVAATTLFTASDADGNAITQYTFYDTGGSGGHFLLNGVTQPINADITITSAQLANLQYQGGSGQDTLWVQAFDGVEWSQWSNSFTVTVSPYVNAPFETALEQSFTQLDADDSTITSDSSGVSLDEAAVQDDGDNLDASQDKGWVATVVDGLEKAGSLVQGYFEAVRPATVLGKDIEALLKDTANVTGATDVLGLIDNVFKVTKDPNSDNLYAVAQSLGDVVIDFAFPEAAALARLYKAAKAINDLAGIVDDLLPDNSQQQPISPSIVADVDNSFSSIATQVTQSEAELPLSTFDPAVIEANSGDKVSPVTSGPVTTPTVDPNNSYLDYSEPGSPASFVVATAAGATFEIEPTLTGNIPTTYPMAVTSAYDDITLDADNQTAIVDASETNQLDIDALGSGDKVEFAGNYGSYQIIDVGDNVVTVQGATGSVTVHNASEIIFNNRIVTFNSSGTATVTASQNASPPAGHEYDVQPGQATVISSFNQSPNYDPLQGDTLHFVDAVADANSANFIAVPDLVSSYANAVTLAASLLHNFDYVAVAYDEGTLDSTGSLQSGQNFLVVFANVDGGLISSVRLVGLNSVSEISASTIVNHAPNVTGASQRASFEQSFAASSLFSVTDADADTISEYDLWDSGAGGGHFVVNGVVQGANQDIFISATQLAQTRYQSGAAGDQVWVRANDGTDWSPWSSSFTITGTAYLPPIVTVKAIVLSSPSTPVAASGLFTASDPQGLAITEYAFWNSGTNGGHFLLNGVSQSTNAEIDVTSAQLAQLRYQGGIGSDTLWIKAFDGTAWSAWSNSFAVSVPLPAVTVTSDGSATKGQVVSLSSLVAIADPDHVGYQELQLWDSSGTLAGGRFVINGVAQSGNTAINVSPANIANTVFDVGTAGGTDILWAQIVQSNGSVSGWQQFSVTVPQPTVSVTSKPSATRGQAISLSSLVAIVDPANVGYQQLELWDSNGTAAGGQFVVNGAAQTGGHEIDVSAANIASTVFHAGTVAGTDTLWARLLETNGTLTTWQQFTVTVPLPSLTVTSNSSAARSSHLSLSSLVAIADPGNVGYQTLELWDSNGTAAGGQFVVNSVAQTGGHEIDVTPANVANTAFVVGTQGGTDTLWARLLETNGTLTAWQQFTITAVAGSNPTVSGAVASSSVSGSGTATVNLLQNASDPNGAALHVANLVRTDATTTLPAGFTLNGNTISVDTNNAAYSGLANGQSFIGHFSFSVVDSLGLQVQETATVTIQGSAFKFSALNVPAATNYSVPVGINNNGDVVGYYYNSDGTLNAYSYNGAGSFSTFNLPALGAGGSGGFGSTSNVSLADINNAGKMVGSYVDVNGNKKSFIPNGSGLASFTDSLATNGTFATGINDSGLIVGYYQIGSVSYGFTDNAGTVSTLNLGTNTVANGINNAGEIVGYFTDSGGTHGFLDNNGTITALNDSSSASFTEATGINSSGQIVGFYKDATGAYHGFIDVSGIFTTVDDPAASSFAGASGTGTKLTGINDAGQMTGEYGNFQASTGLQGFVANPTDMTIAAGGALVIGTPFSGSVTFAGSTGTLTIADAAGFNGNIAGQLAIGDVIDLSGITAGASAIISYSGNNSPGTLTVSDGANVANIALLGNYMASSFVASSDGHGGTSVIDPPASQVGVLVQPAHA